MQHSYVDLSILRINCEVIFFPSQLGKISEKLGWLVLGVHLYIDYRLFAVSGFGQIYL